MFSAVKCIALNGLEGYLVRVQVDVSAGMPAWDIVGLPDASVREAKERVKTAIKNSRFEIESRKITVNLAPANFRKEGTSFDLPIAVGILKSFGYIKYEFDDTIFTGELSLDGTINKVKGILPICIEAKKLGIKRVIVPVENEEEGAIVDGIEIIGVRNLKEVVGYLNKITKIKAQNIKINNIFKNEENSIDFSDVRGHENIKRALEVAVAGLHGVLMIGGPRITEKQC